MPENPVSEASRFSQLLTNAKSLVEKLKPQLPIQIIDEHFPGNVLSDKGRLPNFETGAFLIGPYSTEGFSENPQRQLELAQFMGDNFYSSGDVLDTGFGGNQFILDYFSSKGIKADGIDAQQGPVGRGNLFVPPNIYAVKPNGVTLASGDISLINAPQSQLKDRGYGLVVFNGSWHSAGNNWTVGGEILEAKYHQAGGQTSSIDEFMEKEKQQILEICKGKLISG